MAQRITTSFSAFADFEAYRDRCPILYFHVYRNVPDLDMLEMLDSLDKDNIVLLLDVNTDGGFLTTYKIVTDISKDLVFVTKNLSKLSGIGSWTKGGILGFAETASDLNGLVVLSVKMSKTLTHKSVIS